MIIRKPYAFLIKNFRKIHIVLLLLSIFVAYKLIDVNSFVQEFMQLGTYDTYSNPITKHITIWLQIAIIILIVGSGAIILLLRHKNKPWKIYLVPFIEYLVLFFVLSMIKNFFNGYTDAVETTDLRMSRDLLAIFLIIQLASIGIFIMRTFGLDIKKFNFNSDEEFLELSEADREEIELRLDIDINTFKRTYKKLIRNIGYVYREHKIICNFIIITLCILIVFSIYKFIFITNKSYKQGEYYNTDGYTIKVNNTYYTDKDDSGNIISKDKDFVIVDVTITNNIQRRNINLDNFHLKTGTSDFITTDKTYAEEFEDLGECIDTNETIRRGQTLNTIIIYKVDKKKWNSNFVLYYQENNNKNKLRKIKLNIKDISKIGKVSHLKLKDNIKIKSSNTNETISFDDYEVNKTLSYYINDCSSGSCIRTEKNLNANDDDNILMIRFGSKSFDNKNMIDFFKKYCKIIYEEEDGSSEELDIDFALNNSYYGKYVYILVPNFITSDSKLDIKIIYRNKQYLYKLN